MPRRNNRRQSLKPARSNEADASVQFANEGPCTTCLNKTLLGTNFLLMLGSLALCGLGIVGIIYGGQIRERADLLQDLPVETVAWIVMLLGGLAAFGCACGFWGGITTSAKTRRGMLSMYLFILFTAMLMQLCMCIFLYTYESVRVLDDTVYDKWFEEGAPAKERRIRYQDYFECCGWETPYDSRASGYNTPCSISAPISCRDATMDFFEANFQPMALMGIVLALTEILSVVATIALLIRQKEGLFEEFEGID